MANGAKSNANSTRGSQAVTHPSTNRARRCLISVIGREPVLSTWYGRWRMSHQSSRTIFCRNLLHATLLICPLCTIIIHHDRHLKRQPVVNICSLCLSSYRTAVCRSFIWTGTCYQSPVLDIMSLTELHQNCCNPFLGVAPWAMKFSKNFFFIAFSHTHFLFFRP